MEIRTTLRRFFFYGGLSKEEFHQVKELVAESNHSAVTHWSVLVSLFWCYCLLMSLKVEAYTLCRRVYADALLACVVSFLITRFLDRRSGWIRYAVMYLFEFSLLFAGIGIAMCQWDARSLTMFTVAIIAPSIYIDRTITSVIIHVLALAVYILFGKSVIDPEVFSWGLGNYIFFSVAGILIGYAINKDRFERYVFADSAQKLAELQTRYAYYDQMTGLKNRRAYTDRIMDLEKDMPPACCVVMIDINGLKQTNDSMGHNAGDELIVGTAECIRAAFPRTNEAYRLGGDEFCLILTENIDSAEDSLAAMDRAASAWNGQYIKGISLAFGSASDRDCAEISEIVKTADARMYEAKRAHYQNVGNDRRRRG